MTKQAGEILSPVGNAEMLTAAVRAGADAVYLGARRFSARRNAQNFGEEELREAVSYCHIRGVRVYLALNIILRDEELEEAIELAENAYAMGIDGLIIADLGLAAILHERLPDLALHASTQMSIDSPGALPWLKSMGFSRVVAGREMTRAELQVFCAEAEKLGIETEVFVHGALCMSVSGQCLLSAFLGGRSGNRGLCAGPCRLPFSAPGGTGYDLSLKDLSLLPYLRELREMGVTSFKIEGRMKRPEYVAAATAAARAALEEGKPPAEWDRILQNVFSRSGFTAGYYEGKFGKEMFGIRTKEDVAAAGDVFPLLHELIRTERRSVPITATLAVRADQPISLRLTDGVHTAEATGACPQPAQNKPATKESLQAALDKFGSTPYLADILVETEPGLFVRQSDLNELRRTAVAQLDRLRAAVSRPKAGKKVSVPKVASKPHGARKRYARFETFEQIPDCLDGIDGLIFPLEQDWKKEVPVAEKVVETPRGIVEEKVLRERLAAFYADGFRTVLCGNPASMQAAKELGFRIMAGNGWNIINSAAAGIAAKTGADQIILSAEVTRQGLDRLASPVPCGIVAYGYLPLMLFRNCPIRNGQTCAECGRQSGLTDRKGACFPVRCRMGYSELLNSVPIWLADRAEDLAVPDFTVLYFTVESRERAEQVIRAYDRGEAPDTAYTRGLFYRGTK